MVSDGAFAALTPWLKRALTVALLAVVAYLVIRQARALDWQEVWASVGNYGLFSIAVAFALAIPGQLACASFDLIGRHATGHTLPVPRVMLISFTGYYFSLNLGALVGGLAFRYRLYVPYGFSATTISQIIGLSVLTNWTGYVLIAGVLLAFQPPSLPADWGPGSAVLRVIGGVLLASGVAYVALCAVRGGAILHIRDTELKLPTVPVAGLQILLSVVSWASIGAVLVWLNPGEAGWFTVMPVLMVSAIAGIWSHVPSGLGVIEVVFITMLQGQAADGALLAAVLVYRATYYVAPFVLAVIAYLYLEASARKRGTRGEKPERQ